jgi:hypothetical protein
MTGTMRPSIIKTLTKMVRRVAGPLMDTTEVERLGVAVNFLITA